MQALLYFCFLLFHIVPFMLVGYQPNVLNITTILAIILSFHFGVVAGIGRRAAFTSGQPWTFVVPRFAIPLLALAYLIMRYDNTLELFRSLAEGRIQEAMLSAAVERYSGTAEVSVLTQASTAVFFTLAGLIGSELGRPIKVLRMILLSGISLVVVTIQGSDLSRASLALALLLGVCFYLFNARENLSKKGIIWGLKMLGGAVFLVGAIFIFAQYGRVYQEDNSWQIVGDRAYNLFLGGHYAFLSWLDTPKFGGNVFGSGMFAFVNKLLGIDFFQGNYDQIETPVGFTNIFLWYRGAIEDFSYGFILFPLLCGYSIFAISSTSPNRAEVLLVMLGVQLILFPFYSSMYFTVFAVPFFALVWFLPKTQR